MNNKIMTIFEGSEPTPTWIYLAFNLRPSDTEYFRTNSASVEFKSSTYGAMVDLKISIRMPKLTAG